MSAIDTKTVFTLHGLTVTLSRYHDEDMEPENYGPGSAYDDDDVCKSFRSGDWEFNIIVAEITWNDVVIGGESLGSVEHGTMRWRDENGAARVTECDAFTITPPDYEDPNVVTGGSPATDVIMSAVENARQWAATAADNGPLLASLTAAEQWADPNAHKRNQAS